MSVRVENTNNISVLNRKHEMKNYSSTSDLLLRPDLQEMFRVSEKVGYVKRIVKNMIGTSEEAFLMILTDMGLLLLDTNKFDFKGFIPLLGTKLRSNTSHLRQEAKGGIVCSLDIVVPGAPTKETIVFSSEVDKQEWTTKMMKVQEKSITV